MTVQIKPLRGFINHYNHEQNTLSLLVKSNCDLQEHLSSAREKLLTSLTSIIDHHKTDQDIYFYHKLQVSHGRRTDYLKTKRYKTALDSLKVDLNASIENLLSFAPSKFVSHFVNVIILIDNEPIELSDDKFHELNYIIRSKLTKINNEGLFFVDNDKDDNDVGQIEKSRKESLFIDDNDIGQFEKSRKVSLFIDDDDDDPFEKALINAKEIALRLKRDIKITNKKFISLLEDYLDYLNS